MHHYTINSKQLLSLAWMLLREVTPKCLGLSALSKFLGICWVNERDHPDRRGQSDQQKVDD